MLMFCSVTVNAVTLLSVAFFPPSSKENVLLIELDTERWGCSLASLLTALMTIKKKKKKLEGGSRRSYYTKEHKQEWEYNLPFCLFYFFYKIYLLTLQEMEADFQKAQTFFLHMPYHYLKLETAVTISPNKHHCWQFHHPVWLSDHP